MLRLLKLTDYAIAILSYLAKSNEGQVRTTREIADYMSLPLPTVRKVLRNLTCAQFVVTYQGKDGGYKLAKPAIEISLMDIISVLEPNFSVTTCTAPEGGCPREKFCCMSKHWKVINLKFLQILSETSLADIS